ncbi:MAG: penicillin acylase family protein [Marinilabiliales bacterium]|nr:penicillin acylase family protein [Marinilabiliales bacterium]
MDGNIGYQMPGDIPIRAKGDGTLPVPGWTDEYEWTGFIPFEEQPYTLNPAEGYIVTANNQRPAARLPVPHHLRLGLRLPRPAHRGHDPQRARQDRHRLHPVHAGRLIRRRTRRSTSRCCWGWSGIRRRTTSNCSRAGTTRTASIPPPRLCSTPSGVTCSRTPSTTTCPTSATSPTAAHAGTRSCAISPRTAPGGTTNPPSGTVETREDIMKKSFEEGIAELEDIFGRDTSKWNWGEMHASTFRNGTLGESGIGLIEDLFNRGPYPTSGGEIHSQCNGLVGERRLRDQLAAVHAHDRGPGRPAEFGHGPHHGTIRSRLPPAL